MIKGLNRTVFYNLTALHISCDEEMFGQQWTTTVALFPGTKRAKVLSFDFFEVELFFLFFYIITYVFKCV